MAFSRSMLLASVAGLVMFGGLNTLTTKIQLSLDSVGLEPGVEKPFQKPWFATFAMFAGMTAVLVPYRIMEARRGRTAMAPDSKQQLLSGEPALALSERQAFLYVGIPAIFDLCASGLMFGGLIYISASIWQMLRGSEIVFCAIISVPALGEKLHCYHWLGVLLCVVGICCVCGANVLNSSHADTSAGSSATPAQAMFGMSLVVAAQVVQAAQMVAEEKLLKDVELPPMKIVGYEGIWGASLCILVVFPVAAMIPGSDVNSLENTWDTIDMLRNNHSLLALVLIYVFSCATYNVAGMMVTSELSAVHRTMLEASRTLFIWLVDLSVHYLIGPSMPFGEAWMPYSPLQLVGFLILVLGQSVYGAVIQVPGLRYPTPPPAPKWQSPAAMKSLSPVTRSPA